MTIQITPTNGTVKDSETSRLSSFKEMREGLHISFSQMSQYMICPLKFQFQYVLLTDVDFFAGLDDGAALRLENLNLTKITDHHRHICFLCHFIPPFLFSVSDFLT